MGCSKEDWAVFWCSLLSPLRLGAIPEARRERYFQQLSREERLLPDGQRKRISVATVLSMDPSVLVMDEPSAGLSPKYMTDIFDCVKKVNEMGVSVLMVEQNARRALEISDHGYVLDMGKNRHEGPGTTLASDPAVVGIYFGKKR